MHIMLEWKNDNEKVIHMGDELKKKLKKSCSVNI